MIVAKTPFRISFFGGGSDFPAWYNEHEGAVLSSTINKYCYITCRHLPGFFDYKHRFTYSEIESVNKPEEVQHPVIRAMLERYDIQRGLEVSYNADLPARSGLGSSSAFTAGLLNAIHALNEGRRLCKRELLARTLELEHNILHENSGSQDQVAAVYGGLNFIKFAANDEIKVEKAIIPRKNLEELQDSLLLVFTGIQRMAEGIEADKLSSMNAHKVNYRTIHQMAIDAYSLLQSPNFTLTAFGELLNTAWKNKKELSKLVTNSYIDEICQAGLDAGAVGTKVLGAGGGGFVLFVVPQELKQKVRQKLQGLIDIPVKFETAGSSIVLYEPEGI
jgi:D-glycero-alpha-D-manno-heptose-7-phosphate kinase